MTILSASVHLLLLIVAGSVALIGLLALWSWLSECVASREYARVHDFRARATRARDRDEAAALCAAALRRRRWRRVIRMLLSEFGPSESRLLQDEWELFLALARALEACGDHTGAQRALGDGAAACRQVDGPSSILSICLEWHRCSHLMARGQGPASDLIARVRGDLLATVSEMDPSDDSPLARHVRRLREALQLPWPADPAAALDCLDRLLDALELPEAAPWHPLSSLLRLLEEPLRELELSLAAALPSGRERALWCRIRLGRLALEHGWIGRGIDLLDSMPADPTGAGPSVAAEFDMAVIEAWHHFPAWDARHLLEGILERSARPGGDPKVTAAAAASLAVLCERAGETERASSLLVRAQDALGDPNGPITLCGRGLQTFLADRGATRLQKEVEAAGLRKRVSEECEWALFKMVPARSESVVEHLEDVATAFDGLLASGAHSEARGMAALAARRAIHRLGRTHPVHATWVYRMGQGYHLERESHAAAGALDECLRILEAAPPADATLMIRALALRSRVALSRGEDAAPFLERLEAVARTLSPGGRDLEIVLLEADVKLAQGDHAGALQVLEQALASSSGQSDGYRLQLLTAVFRCCADDREADHARDRWFEAMTCAAPPLGDAIAQACLAFLEQLERASRTEDLARLCDLLRSRPLADDVGWHVRARIALAEGLVHERAGRLDESLERYDSALRSVDPKASELHPIVIESLEAMVRIHRLAGRKDESRRLLGALAARAEDALGDHSSLARMYRRSCESE